MFQLLYVHIDVDPYHEKDMATYSASVYAFSNDFKDTYLHIPFVKYHHQFLYSVWHNKPYQWKLLPSQLAMSPRSFHIPYFFVLFISLSWAMHYFFQV